MHLRTKISRRRALRIGAASTATLAALSFTRFSGRSSAMAAEKLWLDVSQPPLLRANALLASMTFEQKIQLALSNTGSALLQGLGIPAQINTDGPNGVVRSGADVTVFPSAENLAATFDTHLAEAFGQAVAQEVRGVGKTTWLAPDLDIARTPLYGRLPEGLGEDPYLAGLMGSAIVRGAKSQYVLTMLKHFVNNNQEYGRIGWADGAGVTARTPAYNVIISEKALQEIYLAPFKAAVQLGGADAVMASYFRVNGHYSSGNTDILGTLKNSWGFHGFVAPDFIFANRDPLTNANAGLDRPSLDDNSPGGPFGSLTPDMFTSGQISAERCDDICRRVLYALFDSGLFDHPGTPAVAQPGSPAHVELAATIAQASMVLLKNGPIPQQGHKHSSPAEVLPLTASLSSLAIIGPGGDDAVYAEAGGGATAATITPLAGIQARAGSTVMTHTAQGSLGDVALPTIPVTVLTPSHGAGNGLSGQYWSNGDQAGLPYATRLEASESISSPPALPDSSSTPPVWSARLTGTVTPPQAGLYRFSVAMGGNVQLRINNALIASGSENFNGVIQGKAMLKAGVPATIRLDYSNKASIFGSAFRLGWQPPDTMITDAMEAARKAEAAIVIVNNVIGEGMDRSTLALPGDQDALIEAVASVNPRTIVILNTGGPVLMPWLKKVGAVLQAWYPGQQFGMALAAVLFGDVNPGGRLPITFPASDEQGPITTPAQYPGVDGNIFYTEGISVGYRWYDRHHQQPLFPFGYGLSYTHFRLAGLKARVHTDGSVTVTAQATNIGQRAGSDVVQLYLGFPTEAGEPPRQLKGIAKVNLQPGQSKQVSFTLGAEQLSIWDEQMSAWVVVPGVYALSLTDGSLRDRPLEATFTLSRRK